MGDLMDMVRVIENKQSVFADNDREAAVEYGGEARLGPPIHLIHRREESSFSLPGETDGKRLFRLRLDYAL